MIYIATNQHGQGVRHVTAFDDHADFLAYADEVLACNDANLMLRGKPSIARICEALYDNGIGFGSRSHSRISRDEAQELVGWARIHGCYNLRGVE
jgi:hypothetical protein